VTKDEPTKDSLKTKDCQKMINNHIEKLPCAHLANELTSPGLQSDSYFEHKTSSVNEDEPTDELELS
jgi:hypothetical protein